MVKKRSSLIKHIVPITGDDHREAAMISRLECIPDIREEFSLRDISLNILLG